MLWPLSHCQIDITTDEIFLCYKITIFYHSKVIVFAWEDIKAMFNGGSRKRMIGGTSSSPSSESSYID